jgi:protein-S-isoprenylcysteine O-methyltransferase Ste14
MSQLGRAPIHPVLFVIAKLAAALPHLLLAVAAAHARAGTLAFPRVAPVAVAAVVIGVTVLGIGVRNLGASLRVGLPDEPTQFREQGLYRVSRNPIYAGLFLSMIGSCVLVPSWLNVASTTVAILLHHRIVLAEERFLDGRFGPVWRGYAARVRRYC